MVFGQVVIGPPGLGKTTYCNGMSELLQLIGRKVVVVNLDHSTDALLYPMSYVEVQSRFGDFEMVDAGPVTLLQWIQWSLQRLLMIHSKLCEFSRYEGF
ncbi:GPN-loop GTPase QQT1-like isoform X3 [Pyrus communis]|uniref:GPN-loop GTPase QQT1-like isoform X3 n=1 Tax=Pyrus communis TaxID=23211 RepID=UPI0035C07345